MRAPETATKGATRAGLPWPEGDPGALSDAAHGAAAAANRLRDGGARVQAAAAAASGWHGQGAAAFHGAVGQERAAMHRGASALEQAAGALRKLSHAVDDAQRLVIALAREVEAAEEAAEIARARAVVAQMAAVAAAGDVMLAGPDPPASLESAASSAADDATAAGGVATNAESAAHEIRARNTRRAQEACDHVLNVDSTTAGAVHDAAAAAPFASLAPGTPSPAQGFAQQVLSGLTEDQWRRVAYWAAGIDGGAWNPYAGLGANDANVQAVYAFYGRLFLDRPELQWAGMANLVGPMFYAGWQDIYAVRNMADGSDRAEYLSRLVGLPTLPGWAYDGVDLAGRLPGGMLNPGYLAENLTAGELRWYENRFLDMQKQIFDDLAWKHEAYALGGIGLMRGLADNGTLNPRELPNWENIASGDPQRVAEGNKALLRREQSEIIQDDYNAMREHHGPVGDVFTYVTTAMADNPMPGGHSYTHDYPITVGVEVDTPKIPVIGWDPPDPGVNQTLPLPDGNISNLSDRWRWIESDMLPHYQQLLQQPGAAQHLVGTPVPDRADGFRKLPDIPYDPHP